MYENVGYLGMYGKDVLITIIIFIIAISIVAHSSYQSIISELQHNWNANKCNPIVMPFAGIIMPKPGQTTMDTTFENFSYCIQQDVSSILSILMIPFEFVLYLTITLLGTILNAIAALLAFIAWLKAQVSSIFEKLLQKVIGFIIPIIEIIVHMQDTLGKISGILITSLYTSMNIYNLTVSGIINILTILINILIGLIAVFVAMVVFAIALLPTPGFMVGLAVYSAATIMLVGVIIPPIILCLIMHQQMNDIFHTHSPKPPKKPKVKKLKKHKK